MKLLGNVDSLAMFALCEPIPPCDRLVVVLVVVQVAHLQLVAVAVAVEVLGEYPR